MSPKSHSSGVRGSSASAFAGGDGWPSQVDEPRARWSAAGMVPVGPACLLAVQALLSVRIKIVANACGLSSSPDGLHVLTAAISAPTVSERNTDRPAAAGLAS